MAETLPDFTGSTALVTGSTSGIGLGIAEALAGHGASIVMNGFGSHAEIDAAMGQVRDHGVEVRYHGADLRDPAQIADMMDFALREFDSVDTLVNNAGIQYVAPIHEFPVDRWDDIIAVNQSAVFHTTRLALPGMLERDRGRIVNVASAHGLVASVNKAAYVAAKHAVLGLTKVTGLETAGTGVTANAICPGWVLTPLVQRQVLERAERDGVTVDTARAALLGEKQPSGEFVTVQEIGRVAVMLADPAMRSFRGAAIPIDGGWTAR